MRSVPPLCRARRWDPRQRWDALASTPHERSGPHRSPRITANVASPPRRSHMPTATTTRHDPTAGEVCSRKASGAEHCRRKCTGHDPATGHLCCRNTSGSEHCRRKCAGHAPIVAKSGLNGVSHHHLPVPLRSIWRLRWGAPGAYLWVRLASSHGRGETSSSVLRYAGARRVDGCPSMVVFRALFGAAPVARLAP